MAQYDNSNDYLHSINFKNGSYSGTGIEWILKKSDYTQYYLFGEQHGNKVIPQFVDFIHDTLNTKSLHHLAVEMDSWTTKKINEKGIEAIVALYPHNIAFDYDQEITLLRSARKRSKIWGLDQMFIAIHPFQRLNTLAANESARRLTQGAFLKASLKMGNYIRTPHYNDLSTLANTYNDNPSKEAQEILAHLQKSMEIYVAYKQGQQGTISPQVSVSLREQFMIQQFDRYMMENPQQKLVFKMGGAHLIRGIGPNGVRTLGDYVSNTATRHGTTALALGIFNYNDNLPFDKEELFRHSNISLLDCKAYMEAQSDSLLQRLSQRNRTLFQGYDALILIKDGERSSRNIIQQQDAHFKLEVVRKVSSGGIAFILLVLLTLFTFIYSLFRSQLYRKHRKPLITFLLISIGTLVFFGLQLYVILNDTIHAVILPAHHSIWHYMILVLAGLYLSYVALVFKGKKGPKIYLWMGTGLNLFLICFMYYWNIGGMLSF